MLQPGNGLAQRAQSEAWQGLSIQVANVGRLEAVRRGGSETMNTQSKKWYVASTGNHQGLIIDETDGRNVATAYDKADAPLIAAAPELLEALQACLEGVATPISDHPWAVKQRAAHTKARAVIAKATGTP
jgi:hypothetical protein